VQINDQGREFCNEVAERLHSLCGVKQRVTSAYHPQANGLVERANRTIQGAFMRTLQEQIGDWPDALYPMLFAYRTSTHRSTGKTPFEVFLRQESKDATANVHG
jgi:transposase